jgi:hypothetical protein
MQYNPGTYQRTPLQIALRRRKQAVNSIEVHRRGIASLEARIAELTAEIEALGGEPKPKKIVIDLRSKGEMQRALFDMLRERGEITAEDLARAMAVEYKLPFEGAVAQTLRKRAAGCFARNERQGRVRQVGWSESKTGKRAHGRFKRFALAIQPHAA